VEAFVTDSLQRFIFEGLPVRGEIVHLDATWRAVLDRHRYPAPLRSLLGELMAAAALLSATLKFTGSLILQIQGSGKVKLVVVECNSDQTMRATAKWDGELSESGFRELVGDGRFAITITPGETEQTYQGIVSLEGESVSAVLEHYMATSEQLETRLWLSADARQAAGLLLQRVPGALDKDPDAWTRAVTLGDTVTPHELLTLPARQIIHRLFHQEDIRLFDPRVVSFRCSCSRDRVVNMMRLLGREEIRSIVAEHGTVEVICEFCSKRYVFDPVDAEQVFAANVITRAAPTRH
jgi:molecular chaperone Hsp33